MRIRHESTHDPTPAIAARAPLDRRRLLRRSVAGLALPVAARGVMATHLSAKGAVLSNPASPAAESTPAASARSGYAQVNGLEMYYEIHGSGSPLVLLHGGLSTIDVDFGRILPGLSQTHQVIGIEQQAHGHTADIDRPLSFAQMADDTAALLQSLDIANADIFGFSVGSGIAMELAMRYPDLVRKLVLATPSFSPEGSHPGQAEGMESITAEMMVGSPYYDAYMEVAPNPDDFPALLEKIKALSAAWEGWSPEAIEAIKAPTLIIIADSDIVRTEHAVEMFRLLGGGVNGAVVGLPASELAVLPGTDHLTLVFRADWLISMIEAFLARPMPEAG